MNDDDPQHDDDPGVLVRIARTLGVPVATFFTVYPTETPDTETAVAGLEHPTEAIALMHLFVGLKSPDARARCLAYVEQEAAHDG